MYPQQEDQSWLRLTIIIAIDWRLVISVVLLLWTVLRKWHRNPLESKTFPGSYCFRTLTMQRQPTPPKDYC